MATYALYSVERAIAVVGTFANVLVGSSVETCTATASIEQVAVPELVGSSLEVATAVATAKFGAMLSGASMETASGVASIVGGYSIVSMTTKDTVNDILRMWGLCCDDTDDLEQCVKDEALGILNGSMQFIFLHGKSLPFLAKRTRTYYVEDTQWYVTLESDVQSIIGNVRYGSTAMSITRRVALPGNQSSMEMPFATGGKVIFILTDILASAVEFAYGTDYTSAETLKRAIQARILNDVRVYVTYRAGRDITIAFDGTPKIRVPFTAPPEQTIAFGDVWLVRDNLNAEIASAAQGQVLSQPFVSLESQLEVESYTSIYGATAPPAYYVQCDQSNAATDGSRIRLDMVNTADNFWLSLDVLVEPQRVTWADFNSSATLPFPHRYVESLLLPIARYRASSARRYRQRERHQSVVDQYKEALAMLGYADPQLAEVKEGRAEQ